MCSDPEDLRQRAGWDGASGSSRQRLLANLHRKYTVLAPLSYRPNLIHEPRLHPRIGHDPPTAFLHPPSPSHLISTPTMHISQLPLSLIVPIASGLVEQGVLVIRRPPMRQDGVPTYHDDDTGGAHRRGVEYRVEPRRGVPGECEQGPLRDCVADRGGYFSDFCSGILTRTYFRPCSLKRSRQYESGRSI